MAHLNTLPEYKPHFGILHCRVLIYKLHNLSSLQQSRIATPEKGELTVTSRNSFNNTHLRFWCWRNLCGLTLPPCTCYRKHFKNCLKYSSGCTRMDASEALNQLYCSWWTWLIKSLYLDCPFAADTTRALGLLEEYCTKLRKPEEQQLKTAIQRVMGIFHSNLFGALLGKWSTDIDIVSYF